MPVACLDSHRSGRCSDEHPSVLFLGIVTMALALSSVSHVLSFLVHLKNCGWF